MSGGFTPSIHLFSQSRGRLVWDPGMQVFIPGAPAERTHSAGACRGVFGLAAALEDGVVAAARAAQALGLRPAAERPSRVECDSIGTDGCVGALPQPAGGSGAKAFVDWQNDVTVRDLSLAVREGFRSIEHVKRYTTTGMATDQGKTSNLNALAIVARELGQPIPEVGLTTFRMPYVPVTFGTLAGHARGDLFDPVRRTPLHDGSAARGAVFEDAGLWKRALYFRGQDEDAARAVARECRAVRNGCGIFDASTLGKIEVVGPDAAEFLNRLYVNELANLAVGRCRYGILLRDDGYVFDDGVIARKAPDRFHVTTTTGGAGRVLALMEDYRQTEWPDLRVWLTSTTEQWAVIAIQGPQARQLLQPHVEGIDLTSRALPHMSIATGRVFGVPLLLFRVSFTGELGFELNVPADYAAQVWESLFAAGEPCGLTPYGTDAMHRLRAEKGYIIVGQDTDGTVSADDAGLGWAVSTKKPEFLGKRSLERRAFKDPARKQLVGLLTEDTAVLLEEGAQIAERPGLGPSQRALGHVTSAYASEAVGRPIAMGLVAAGRSRLGQTLFVPMQGRDVRVTVTSPVFYDPDGERLNV
jgi:sarcosine oxidase subunit alpha